VAVFGHEVQVAFLRGLGCEPTLRKDASSGSAFVTDNGNHIYDCRFAGGIGTPAELEARLKSRAGVVETGLFLGMAGVVLIGSDGGVETRLPK
jgi:ribose 5-phosphate isomerase A